MIESVKLKKSKDTKMSRKAKRTLTQEFKQQMINLYLNGKPRADILKEYDLTTSSFDQWLKQSQSTGSFKAKDNRTPEEQALIELKKENQQLKMENDILKQAALIMGRKSK